MEVTQTRLDQIRIDKTLNKTCIDRMNKAGSLSCRNGIHFGVRVLHFN